jgi:hypothetical protein
MFDACYQWPIDERDYPYSEVCGGWDIHEEHYINDNELQDQNAAGYPYGCVFFSDSQGSNIMNFLEGSEVRSTGWELCDYAHKQGLFDPNSGAAIASGPKVWKALGYLSGYAKISTIDEICHSIANGRPVQCGSNQIDWSAATAENGWTVSGKSAYWHSIILNGYSYKTKQFRIKQSYDRWDSGHQFLNFSDFGLLYPSKYSLIDSPDPIITYRQKLMDNISIDAAKDFFKRGYTNWERPKDPITREEAWALLERIIVGNNLK